MAAEYLDDVTLHLEAESAAVRIARATAGSDPQRTKEVLQKVIQSTKNDTLREQAQQIIKQADRFEDYIVAWQVSGPYMKENVDAAEVCLMCRLPPSRRASRPRGGSSPPAPTKGCPGSSSWKRTRP